jgi:hypothetical protein
MANPLQLEFNFDTEKETRVYCSPFDFMFLSRHTLAQLQDHPSLFDCHSARVSRKGNLCCDGLSGNSCPVQRAMYSPNPPAEPLTYLGKAKVLKV